MALQGPGRRWPWWYLEYFWKLISLGTERGKMTKTQRAERVKRWSAYQGGDRGAPLSVPLGYRESHTVGSSREISCAQRMAQGGQEHHTMAGPGSSMTSGSKENAGAAPNPHGTIFPSLPSKLQG